MKIYISKLFLDSVKRLTKEEVKMLESTLDKFRYSRFRPSLNEEKLNNEFKSVRINLDLRIIFYEQESNIVLAIVDHHDQAYDWANSNRLATSYLGYPYFENTRVVFDNLKIQNNKESLFESMGINQETLNKIVNNQGISSVLITLETIDQVYDKIEYFQLPEETKEAIIKLTKGHSLESIISEVSKINKYNLIEEASDRFKTLSFEELYQLFGNDFETWQVFLHPSQKDLVEINANGPILIEGGPGTGKTVVGIHRAIHLSNSVYNKEDNKILLVAFSKKLALITENRLQILAKIKNSSIANIKVDFVGSIIRDTLDKYKIDYKGYDDNAFNSELLYRVKNYPGRKQFSDAFYIKEYEQIIQPNRIKTLEEYLKVSRSGMSVELNNEQKEIVWGLIEYFISNKEKKGLLNHEDVAMLLEDNLDKGIVKPIYDSIIVDEAQDLSPIKLRVLSKLLRTKENNLMLLSDREQRVFKINNYKSQADIDIGSRTYYLTLNYRTSKAIYNYAAKELELMPREKYAKDHDSLYWGIDPILREYQTEAEQIDKVLDYVNELIKVEQYKDYEICIIGNVKKKIEKAQALLNSRSYKTTLLEEKTYPTKESGVCFSTSVGVKGLEFRAVIYLDYNKDIISALPVEGLNQRVRYVACTRSREKLIVLNYISSNN
jgi:superfamily I DNA/RNA helicase